MNAILYIFSAVAAAGTANYDMSSNRIYREWVPAGEYVSMEACNTAIRTLGLTSEKARCVDKNTGLSK